MRCCCSGNDALLPEGRNSESKSFSWSEWKRPLVAILLTFLCTVESTMIGMGEWPYMSTIDHDATATFFGYSTAANRAGHAIFAFVFAIWAHAISGIKIPMLVGRCVTLVACAMYVCVECIPSNRRWWMLVCYFLFGVGFGTSPLLRSYIARVTSEDNRSTAYALQNGAMVLTAVVGPIAQLSFSGLPYPGVAVIPPHIKLNIYSAPIWLALITNIIAIVVTAFVLEDTEKVEENKPAPFSSSFSLASIKDRFSQIRSLNLPWILVALVIFEKMVSGLFNAALGGVVGPMLTAMFALSGEQIVLTMAISQITVGVLAVALSAMFFLCKLGTRISCRALFLFSNLLVIVGYVITYPYPFTSSPLQPYNETTRTGCNPQEYSWCDTQLVVSIYPYIIIMIITISFAAPAALLSLDTIYSKMIGNIDQNVMQAVFVIAEDIMLIVGPIYGSAVFTAIGISYNNIIEGSIYILATIMWLAAWKWLRPYN